MTVPAMIFQLPGPDQDDRAKQDGDHRGLSDRAGNGSDEEVPEARAVLRGAPSSARGVAPVNQSITVSVFLRLIQHSEPDM